MHKNAIKIVWGGLGSQKLCAFYHKCGAFLVGKNCAPFCALFGQKMCAFEFKIIKNSDWMDGFWRIWNIVGILCNCPQKCSGKYEEK